METLKRGSKGCEVQRVQSALNRAGYSITIDGQYGPNTEKAVKKFQQANGLIDDGVCGPATWGCLGLYLLDYSAVTQAVEDCLDAVEKLPEYKRLEAFLYG